MWIFCVIWSCIQRRDGCYTKRNLIVGVLLDALWPRCWRLYVMITFDGLYMFMQDCTTWTIFTVARGELKKKKKGLITSCFNVSWLCMLSSCFVLTDWLRCTLSVCDYFCCQVFPIWWDWDRVYSGSGWWHHHVDPRWTGVWLWGHSHFAYIFVVSMDS